MKSAWLAECFVRWLEGLRDLRVWAKVLWPGWWYCWWNWQEQLRSVERLLDLDVAWLLPGHGHRHRFTSGEWRAALQQTLAWAGR